MEKAILKERRKVHHVGGSKMVALPKWWIQDEEDVELEVYPNKIIIRKGVEE